MTDLQDHVRNVENQARRAALHAGPWIEFLARFGYAAKGAVYALAGILSLLAAFRFASGQVTGSRGAMQALLDQPFGWLALSAIAVGLAGYALWCFVLAVVDPEREGRDWRGLAKRFGKFVKGVVHLGLVGAAAGLLVGITASRGGEDDAIERWTARLMSLPLGVWLVAAAGLGVLFYGGFQVYRAFRPKQLDDQLSLYRLSDTVHRWLLRVSRFGVGARGVIFGVMGVMLVLAALHANPQEAQGVGSALQTIQRQPAGKWLLALVALGLISYGLYEFIRARYRRIDPT